MDGFKNRVPPAGTAPFWGSRANVMDYSLCPICPFAIVWDGAGTNSAHRFYRASELP